MTKTPSNGVSHKSYNINANEDFEMVLTYELHALLTLSLSEWNPNQLFFY